MVVAGVASSGMRRHVGPMSSERPSGAPAGAPASGPVPQPDSEQPGPAFGPPLVVTAATPASPAPAMPPEDGGPSGPEPTRYGDWERKGIAVDF